MTFNYSLMQVLCKELQERVIDFKITDCCPNDPRRFSFILQKGDLQEKLFFCFSLPFFRFHLSTSSPFHTQSHHPLFHFLKGAILKKINLLQQDRILQLTFDTPQGERFFIAEFFSKHPNYYLVQSDRTILFALHPLSHSHYHLPPSHSYLSHKPPSWSSHQEVEEAYAKLEIQSEFILQKQALIQQFNKKEKKLQKKEREIVESLKQCEQWSRVQHEGELIKFHFASIQKGTSSITVQDWITDQPLTLYLNPAHTPQEEMAARFKQAKKLQGGIVPLNQYLEHTKKELGEIQQSQQQLSLIQTPEELASFKIKFPSSVQIGSSSSTMKSPSSTIYREYQSASGVKIWVGRNAKANDRLTFQLANGRDWWLHVRGYPGSHVIIRLVKDQEPDSETLKDALQLALHYSKAREQKEGEVCLTQRKYLSKLNKKKAGLVHISKHQTVWVRFDPARYQKLREKVIRPS